MKMMRIVSRSLTALCVALACVPGTAGALPFNDDMVDNQLRTGSIVRNKPAESIPVGFLKERVVSKEEANALTNPLKGEPASAANGERLFQINCFPCHGDIARAPYVPGPVARFVPGPDLSVAAYHDVAGGRTDGQIYGVISFGSVLMPAVGYKLTANEQWDIINYIRKVQATKGQ